MAQCAVCRQQPSDRVVAVFDAAAPAVFEAAQLAGWVVTVAPKDRRLHADLGAEAVLVAVVICGRPVALCDGAELLFDQAAGRVVLHRLQQAVGLGPARFLVQRVALEGHEVLPVEQQAVHVAGAVGQPIDAVAVGADRSGALVEFVVVVVPDRGALF